MISAIARRLDVAARRGAAGRLRDDQRGITLVELMVAVLVSGIILTAVGAFFISGSRAFSANRSVDTNTRQTANAMQQVTRYLHVATTNPTATGTNAAFLQAAPTSMDFTAYVNLANATAQPVEVKFALVTSPDAADGGKKVLAQTTTASDCSSGYCVFTGAKTTTYLTGPVASPTVNGKPLFTYLDASNNAVPTQADGTVAATNWANIASVTVNLEVGSGTAGTTGNANVTATVFLLNLAQGAATSTGAAS